MDDLKKRNLDGCYFRVERDGKFESVCFTDLTDEERRRIIDGKSADWLRSLCLYLADVVRDLGDTLDLEKG